MKKFLQIKIVLLIIIFTAGAVSAQGKQDTALTKPAIDSSRINPPQLAEKETADDSVKIIKHKKPSAQKQINTKPKNLVEEVFKYDKKLLDTIKQINFFTILEVILLILISFGLFKLFNKAARSALFKNVPSFYFKLLTLLRIFLGVFIFYIIITLLFGSSKEITLAVIFLFIIFLGAASIPMWKNFIGGLIISYNPPFETGDFIKVAGYEGKVSEIQWRFTSIITDDNCRVNIPNSIFLQNPVENINVGQAEHLISLEYEFPFKFDVKKTLELLREAAISTPYAHSKSSPEIFLKKIDFLKESNIFEISMYIFDRRYENEAVNYLNESILSALNKLEAAD